MSPGNLLTDVMRRRSDTCAPLRAALVQLRVANGVKWGRGREEVEVLERQKRRLGFPCSSEAVPRRGWRALHGGLPSCPGTAGGREF